MVGFSGISRSFRDTTAPGSAARFEKRAANYPGMVHIGVLLLWL
jgi:hypothetical protein